MRDTMKAFQLVVNTYIRNMNQSQKINLKLNLKVLGKTTTKPKIIIWHGFFFEKYKNKRWIIWSREIFFQMKSGSKERERCGDMEGKEDQTKIK